MPDTIEWADLDGDVMANPPLTELFCRPSPAAAADADDDEPDDDGGRVADGCLISLEEAAAYAEPSALGATVTTTDAFPPSHFRGGIRGISNSSRSSPAMAAVVAGPDRTGSP